jgi:hypothetical protein
LLARLAKLKEEKARKRERDGLPPKVPKEPLPRWAHRMWLYRRGVGVARCTSLFIVEKLNFLIVEYAVKAYNFGARLIGQPPIPSAEGTTSVAGVERITMRNVLDWKSFTWSKLWTKVTLQEPTFKEIVLLYRPAAPESAAQRNAIYIKSFRDIPMADLEVVLPEKKIGFNSVDLLKFTITGCVGIITAIVNLKSKAVVGWAFAGTFLALLSKVIFDYNNSMDNYRNLLNQTLFEKALNNHTGAVVYLLEQFRQQETKEAVLGYYFLLSRGPMESTRLDTVCEEFLAECAGAKSLVIDFDVRDSLSKLEKIGLVTREGAAYVATPLDQAFHHVRKRWKKFAASA